MILLTFHLTPATHSALLSVLREEIHDSMDDGRLRAPLVRMRDSRRWYSDDMMDVSE